ncbi:MAG: divalent-cation tolerance protein CutA [Candidatus Zixiibacteriota bacterium]
MEQLRVVYITIPRDEAEKMAHEIVEKRLAACVNLIPKITSFFWWDDAVQKDDESLLMVKTTQQRFDDLLIFVRKNHPYDLPEVIAMPLADAFGDYVDWVKAETCAK